METEEKEGFTCEEGKKRKFQAEADRLTTLAKERTMLQYKSPRGGGAKEHL